MAAAAARARAPLSLSRQSLQEGRELVSVVRNRNQGSQSEREGGRETTGFAHAKKFAINWENAPK